MATSQLGSVTVQTLGGQEQFEWADRVSVDRKGALHLYGPHRQHRVFHVEEWKGYLATPVQRVKAEDSA